MSEPTTEPILPPPLPTDLSMDGVIGITTTVPIEVLYAAGLTCIDLNNLFITSDRPQDLADCAETAGFPRTCCCWTKGIYGAVGHYRVPSLLTVTRGDCSNAEALMEILLHEGVQGYTFDYPREQDEAAMIRELQRLADAVGADLSEAERWRERLWPIRQAAGEVDRLSWQESKVMGIENHLWLLSASDFCGDPDRYGREVQAFLETARRREPIAHGLRLGLCGIPPIVPGLYGFLESFGGLVVYNETQRQFAMADPAGSLAEQYTRYTYPYGVFPRIEDIVAECARRRLDGLIHYVQSFCHRRIEDRIIRERVDVPVLTLEGDRPGPLSGQLKTRLEAFVQMLAARKEGRVLL